MCQASVCHSITIIQPSYDQANAKIQALKSDFASIIEDDPERRIELESRLAKLSKFVQENNFSSCRFDRLKYENYLVYLDQQKKKPVEFP